jgi:hypothetical protein
MDVHESCQIRVKGLFGFSLRDRQIGVATSKTKNMSDKAMSKQEAEAAMDAAREWNGRQQLFRDQLKRDNGLLPRNEALEKWGNAIDKMIERDLAKTRGKGCKTNLIPKVSLSRTPEKDVPDLDRE